MSLPMFVKDYLDQRKLRLWDFFRNIDKDGTMRVPAADFRKAVQVSKYTLFWTVNRVIDICRAEYHEIDLFEMAHD